MSATHAGSPPGLLRPVLRFRGVWSAAVLRLVPRVRGGWAVGASLLRIVPPRHRVVHLSLEVGHSVRAVDIAMDLSDPVQYALVRNANFDLVALSVLRAYLRSGDTFLDVGANWGYFTCLGAAVVGPTGLVLSLEPNPRAYARLLTTIRMNGLSNVIPLPYAASLEDGQPVAVVQSWFRQTTSAYVQPAGAEVPNALTVTLDRIVEKMGVDRVGAIKIDTEGAELRVLEGAANILRRWRPLMLVEVSRYSERFGYSAKDLYTWMRRMDYARVYLLDERARHHEVRQLHEEPEEGQVAFLHASAPPLTGMG